MAIRLPQQNYGPVQSMGRYDIYAPMRTAQARTNALMKLGNVAKTWADAEVAKEEAAAIAEYKRKTNALKQTLLTGDMIDLNAFPDVEFSEEDRAKGVAEIDPETQQEKHMVPTWTVINKIYDEEESRIRTETTSNLGPKSIRQFEERVVDYQSASSNAIAGKHFNDRHLQLRTEMDMAYDQHIGNDDEVSARQTAEQALKTSAWTLQEYEQRMATLGSDIDNMWYSKRMMSAQQSRDVATLERLQTAVWEDNTNRMTTKQKLQLQSQAYTAQVSVQNRLTTEQRLERKRQSGFKLAQFSSVIHENGFQPWEDVNRVRRDLEPEDQRTLMTLNANAKNEPIKSNPDALNHMGIMIENLNMPSDIPLGQRVLSLKRQLVELTGIDPITGEVKQASLITNADYGRLLDRIDAVAARPMKSAIYQRVEDRLYRIITSGSREQFGLNNTGAQAAMLNAMITEMEQAAAAQGAAFDPEAWFQANRTRIMTETYETNLNEAKFAAFKKYTVREKAEGGARVVNAERTRAKVLEGVQKGELDYDLAKEFLNIVGAGE